MISSPKNRKSKAHEGTTDDITTEIQNPRLVTQGGSSSFGHILNSPGTTFSKNASNHVFAFSPSR